MSSFSDLGVSTFPVGPDFEPVRRLCKVSIITAVPPGRPILVDPTEAMSRSDLRLHLCFRYELRELEDHNHIQHA